jgi:hypothetical protein
LTITKSSDQLKDFEVNQYDSYTIAALEDEVVSKLSAACSYKIDERRTIHITWKYLDSALQLLYKINVFKPIPYFEIYICDLPYSLRKTLESFPSNIVNKLITKAVCRIVESTDPSYYHVSGVHGRIRWKFVD